EANRKRLSALVACALAVIAGCALYLALVGKVPFVVTTGGDTATTKSAEDAKLRLEQEAARLAQLKEQGDREKAAAKRGEDDRSRAGRDARLAEAKEQLDREREARIIAERRQAALEAEKKASQEAILRQAPKPPAGSVTVPPNTFFKGTAPAQSLV